MTNKQIEKALISLKDKGYSKVGYLRRSEVSLDILMIHPTWKSKGWSHMKHFDQALKDVREVGLRDFICIIEAVPLEIYQNERTGGPGSQDLGK